MSLALLSSILGVAHIFKSASFPCLKLTSRGSSRKSDIQLVPNKAAGRNLIQQELGSSHKSGSADMPWTHVTSILKSARPSAKRACFTSVRFNCHQECTVKPSVESFTVIGWCFSDSGATEAIPSSKRHRLRTRSSVPHFDVGLHCRRLKVMGPYREPKGTATTKLVHTRSRRGLTDAASK